ncbi:hypothetical protein MNBD_GAMMA15-650 [hydrothermal vent metagenome]|uniref:O-antigen ligase-related domain-containing protein n=1 Tax=hydrothermal vent metagenome TaxID=652676 RepID=A0A3B0YA71_9ZZZZ
MKIPFLLFLFIVGAEYVGLGSYVPLFRALPIALGISALLLIYVLSKNSISEAYKFKQLKYFSFFIFLTALALFHGLIHSYAIDPLKQQIGYLVLLLIGFYLMDEFRKIALFAMFFVSIHLYLVVINFEKFQQAARVGFYKAGYFLGDGNDFAWSLNVALPMALFLAVYFKKPVYKVAALGGFFLILIGIIGTQSRGATLALSAGILYMWIMVSKQKILGLVYVAIIAAVVALLAPQGYFQRMQTIKSYEEDTSATGRLMAWGHATEMALDHPVLGVGAGSFNSAYGRFYRKPGDPVRWISTHSVYFKILGEYGFGGIFIYLMIIFHTLALNRETRRRIEQAPGELSVPILWPDFLNMSTIGFSVAAMFLSGVNYPHLYLLVALAMATSRLVQREVELLEIKDPNDTENIQPERPVMGFR